MSKDSALAKQEIPMSDTPLAGTHEGGVAADPSSGGTPDGLFLETSRSKYKTPEDAKAGFEQLQSELQKKQQELDDYRHGRETAQRQEQLLERLVDNTAPAQGESDTARDSRLAKLREDAAEDPGMLVDFVAQLTQESEKSYVDRVGTLEQEIEKRVKEQVEALGKQIGALQLSQNPVYQRYGDEVKAAQEKYGVPEDVAIKIVGDIHKDDVAEVEASRIPGSMGSGRITGAESAKVPQEVMDGWMSDIRKHHAEGSAAEATLLAQWTERYQNGAA